MPEKIEEPEEITEAPEPVNFDDPESRMSFLKDQLNDLVDGINDVYGQDLMDELLKRLEKTVEDFNVEVSGLIGKLKAGKIFDEDEDEDEMEAIAALDDVDAEALDPDAAPEKSVEEQDKEDQDIIARMRARISHD